VQPGIAIILFGMEVGELEFKAQNLRTIRASPRREEAYSHLGRQRVDEDRDAFNRIIVVIIVVIIVFFFRLHIGIGIGVGNRPGSRLRLFL
jgi:hypothetical protein